MKNLSGICGIPLLTCPSLANICIMLPAEKNKRSYNQSKKSGILCFKTDSINLPAALSMDAAGCAQIAFPDPTAPSSWYSS